MNTVAVQDAGTFDSEGLITLITSILCFGSTPKAAMPASTVIPPLAPLVRCRQVGICFVVTARSFQFVPVRLDNEIIRAYVAEVVGASVLPISSARFVQGTCLRLNPRFRLSPPFRCVDSPRQVSQRQRKPVAAELGILDLTFQSLRRTFATLIQNSGTVKDAQTQLRHADAQTTMNIYQKSIPASVSSAVESLERKIEQAHRDVDKPSNAVPHKDGDETGSEVQPKRQHRPRGKSQTPTAQLLHNNSGGRFSTVSGSALNRRRWLVRPIGFEPMTFCSGGKRSIRAELRAHPELLL